jgi:hypothetical protein
MRRTRRAVRKAFANAEVYCPKCPGSALQYYGKPDMAAYLRDRKPVRFWCPKCETKYDAAVITGITEEETDRRIKEV